MFYPPNQPVAEKPLPKPFENNKNNETSKTLNSVMHLPIQRFYRAMEGDCETRCISVNMRGEDVERQDMVHYPKENTMDKKATWTDDPLRLCLVESQAQPDVLDQSAMPFSQEEELPLKLKLPHKQLATAMDRNQWIHQHSPHVDENVKTLDKELPFPTAPFSPPKPPPKDITTTPTCPLPKEITTTPTCPPPIILPVEQESYCDQSLMTASTSVFYSENAKQQQQQQQKDVAKESWEAIFHPLSTFKHNKGELEYYAWNSVNLPVAAALVAKRVTHPTSHSMSDMSTHATAAIVAATIPHIMPTPLLKPSPILTIVSAEDRQALERDSSEITLVNNHHEASCAQEGYYYDMLRKIRGSIASSLVDESCSTLQSDDMSVMDKEHTTKDQHIQKTLKRHVLAAALLLGGFTRNKSTQKTNTTLKPPPTTAHNEYAMGDEKHAVMADPETLFMIKPRYWTEKKLFWTGFVCPLLWYYGSVHMKASRNSSSRLLDSSDLRWQKRCRLAAMYFSVILSVVILIVSVKAAGSAGVRQTQTDTIRAVIAD